MFVRKTEGNRVPLKCWLSELSDIEPGCLEQADHLTNLPFTFSHVALMPDTHEGYGMPIGGVLATKGVIIPNAVGVDIGCGMEWLQTDIDASLLNTVMTPNGTLAQQIVGATMRNVPVGFAHQNAPQEAKFLDNFLVRETNPIELMNEVMTSSGDRGPAYYQLGTLGGGNHFIEFQADEDGKLAIMIHSGSRNLGKKICDYFNEAAKKINAKYFSSVPAEWDLAFLPLDSPEGVSYKKWMDLALEFAEYNRHLIMERTKNVVANCVKKYVGCDIKLTNSAHCHHNYAAFEHHFRTNVVVHRKGAIRVRKGDLGIIPGAMGSYSYIVGGIGSPESFDSCSHGAGRRMGRKEATRQFSVDQVMNDFKQSGIVLGKPNKEDVAEEYRLAYKDIDTVIANESDLVVPIKKLRTIAVIKG